MNNRVAAGRKVAALYRRKFRYFGRCLYCGDAATDLDHVLPLAAAAAMADHVDFARPGIRRVFGQGFCLVPSCAECNRFAGGIVFTSIRQKREHIRGKRSRRYRRLLRMPEWSAEELTELGHNLRTVTTSREAARAIVARRLAWPYHGVSN